MYKKGCPRRGGQGWQGRLRGCGYRITVAREAILETLIKGRGKHLSAEDIYIDLHSAHPAIGLTTVYRTLEILAEMAMVSKFDFGDGKARYEVLGEDDKEFNHYHLVCTKCKRVINCKEDAGKEADSLNESKNNLSAKYDFDIRGYLVQFYGICDSCNG